jgi:predicted ATPase/DNA-binding XRE family transcriptional regulator
MDTLRCVTFSDQLVELRLRRCWSQEELAEVSGVSVRTISNLERAATSPQRGTVRALADVLGLEAAERAAFEEAARTAGLGADRSSGANTANLPASLTTIIGRDAEIVAVSRRLRGDRRLVAISGPGGVGKSRLALEVAWRVADQFERADAIDLSALRDRDEALVALAAAVGVPASAPPSVASVSTRIAAASWLLLVDSLEHVPEVTADLARLVELCPRLRVLVTTRTRPDGAVALAPLPPEQALHLLTERVRAVRPGFAVTAQNAAALAALCTRLDGLPLAIELAAGHLRHREPAEVEAELRGRASPLRADVIDVPRRHRTLRDTVAWSTDRLNEPDRQRFAALGSFRGAVPCSAWEAVLRGAGLEAEGLDATVGRLAAASLVNADVRTDRTVTMLDTIREVAEELLADSGLEGRCRSAHARHMLDLVRSAGPAAIESNLDNVRAAVAFAVAHEPSTLDVAVVASVGDHLTARGRFAEAHRVLSAIATATTEAAARGAALLRAGVAANINGDARSALDLAGRARREADSVGDDDLRIASLNLAGGAYKAMGELDAAYRVYLSCLNAATGAGNARYVTVALNNLGTVAHDRGAYADALAHYERSLDLKRDLGEPRAIAVAQVNLANLRRDLGDHAAAREHARAAVGIFRDPLDRYGIAFGLVMLAEAELGLSRLNAAERAAREALEISVEIDHTSCRALAECLLGDLDRRYGRDNSAEAHYLAALEHVVEPIDRARILERLAAVLANRDPVDATALLVQADGIRRRRQYAVPPLDRPLVAATRQRLGLAAVDSSVTVPSAMSCPPSAS